MAMLVNFKGNPVCLEGVVPVVGHPAPPFILTATNMVPVTLQNFAGKVLVLVTVPSLDTPVCDMEVRRFNTEAAALGSNVCIAAVSCDLPFAQARWCGAAGIQSVVTLSDYRDGNFGRSYGVRISELALEARAIFVIDASGVLRYTQVVPEVTQEPDYAAALEAIRALL